MSTPVKSSIARAMLSQTAEYALRAAVYLAEHPERAPSRVGDLARALKIPQNYLSKTLHQLARAGVLSSTRGKHGGFELARPPGELALIDIVAPFEHFSERSRCVLGRPVCSDQTACAAHERWKHVAEATTAFFQETTLRDLLRPTRERKRAAG